MGTTAAMALLLGACSANDAPVGVDPTSTSEATPRALLTDAGYVRTDLGTLGGARSYAADVNNREMVVGWSETATGATHAFKWTEARGMVDLGTLPGHYGSQAIAIVDSWMPGGGQVVGVSFGDAGPVPVVWSVGGGIKPLAIQPLTGALYAIPMDVNSSGTVAGWQDVGSQHAFVGGASGSYDLTANAPVSGFEGVAFGITELGRVGVTTQEFGACGFAIGNCWRTFTWTKGGGYQALGTPGNEAQVAVLGNGMNELGTVVGTFTRADQVSRPFRWRAATGFVELPGGVAPEAFGGAYAQAVNDLGTIVGRVVDQSTGTMVPVIWPAGGGVGSLGAGNPNLAVPLAINERGTVAGWAVVGDGIERAVVWRQGTSGVRALVAAGEARRYAPSAAGACLTSREGGASRQALLACTMSASRGE